MSQGQETSMIVFVAGMSRSGSMWVYNVTRELIRSANKVPLPHFIPPDETDLIKESLSRITTDDEVYCIKTHLWLEPNLPDAKIICTYRDVREAILSFMRFMSCDFEDGLRAARSMMSKTDYYFEKHTKNIIRIRYDELVSYPMAVIKAICEFLNLNVSTDDMQRTLRNHSKERVKALVESLRLIDVTGPGHIADANKREKYETVRNLDGSFRVYDRTTGFQTNHITEAGKDWKTILTEEQKKELMNLTEGWLVKYGFPL